MLPRLLCLAGRTQGAAAFNYVEMMIASTQFSCNGVRSSPATAWTRTLHPAPRRCSAAAPRSLTTTAAASFVAADRSPARAGDRVAAVDTPALLVDLDVFEANCARLRATMAQWPAVAIRPHAKAHKCGPLGALQLSLLGPQASGACAQKLCEAEALIDGGVTDVLVSNQLVAPSKLQRLAALAARPGVRLSVCVDDAGALRELARAAEEAGLGSNSSGSSTGAPIGVLVEVNVGQDRCGVETPREAAALAESATSLGPSIRFDGIQAYHGGLQHVRSPSDRATACAKVAACAAAAVDAIETGAGLKCGVVTGGGSGTYRLDAASGVFTEVQPGSFAFGDADYARNVQAAAPTNGGGGGGAETTGEWGGPGSQALWVLTQVMSLSPSRATAVVDAGTKAVSLDSGPPIVDASWGIAPPPPPAAAAAEAKWWPGGPPAPDYRGAGDEHGLLLYPHDGAVAALGPSALALPPRGALLRLQPGHCDPTVNLYDWLVGVRGDRVEAVWRVGGRGPGV